MYASVLTSECICMQMWSLQAVYIPHKSQKEKKKGHIKGLDEIGKTQVNVSY